MKKINQCRACGNSYFTKVINFNKQYLSSIFPESIDYKKIESPKELNLIKCSKCDLVQLDHSFDLTSMYKNYPYKSSAGNNMKLALKDVVEAVCKIYKPSEDDYILDIGGNDLTTLSYFEKYNCNMVSIDASNVSPVFSFNKLKNIQNKYFSSTEYFKHSSNKAKIVLALAMFYHLDDPVVFLEEVEKVLDEEEGVFVLQMAYLKTMLETNMVDNIVHEHATYPSLSSLRFMLKNTNLEIFKVETNDLYGGSFRVFIKNKKCNCYLIDKSVLNMFRSELEFGLNTQEPYTDFSFGWNITKNRLIEIVKDYKSRGKKIWLLGAPTKFTTVLQNCGFTNKDIDAAAEVAEWKHNKLIIGCDIPIKTEKEMREAKPDLVIISIYSFSEKIIEQHRDMLENGVEFLVPLPYPKIISML